MANYCGSGRSNYFKVKNAKKFLKWAEMWCGITIHPGKTKNEFCILSENESGDFPDEREDKKDSVEFLTEIATHLAEDSVAIFMHCGAEKLRYLCGYAFAINSLGDQRVINLQEIYKMAEVLSHKPSKITEVSY